MNGHDTPPPSFERSLRITHPTDSITFQCHLLELRPPEEVTSIPTLVLCLHGAGCASASFSLLMAEMRAIHSSNSNHPGIMSQHFILAAYDLRGHGSSSSTSSTSASATSDEQQPDLSLSTLISDTLIVINALTAAVVIDCENSLQPPNVVLVGHSLGGAIAVRVAAAAATMAVPVRVLGVVPIDIVEGSAIASLPMLLPMLDARPSSFKNIEEAIKWTLEARMINNPSSALHSVPPMLKLAENGMEYIWRTNLSATSIYWNEYYTGLSQDFLSLPCPKLLILAHTDRLDKTLLIGQMSGKFQLEIIQSAGHSVHEDNPKQTAERLFNFLVRAGCGSSSLNLSAKLITSKQPTFDRNSTFAKKSF